MNLVFLKENKGSGMTISKEHKSSERLKEFRKIMLKDKVVRNYYEKSVKQKKKLSFEQYIEECLIDIYR